MSSIYILWQTFLNSEGNETQAGPFQVRPSVQATPQLAFVAGSSLMSIWCVCLILSQVHPSLLISSTLSSKCEVHGGEVVVGFIRDGQAVKYRTWWRTLQSFAAGIICS